MKFNNKPVRNILDYTYEDTKSALWGTLEDNLTSFASLRVWVYILWCIAVQIHPFSISVQAFSSIRNIMVQKGVSITGFSWFCSDPASHFLHEANWFQLHRVLFEELYGFQTTYVLCSSVPHINTPHTQLIILDGSRVLGYWKRCKVRAP